MKPNLKGYKSAEEMWFSLWLDDLKTVMQIEWKYEPEKFLLSDAVFRNEEKIMKSGKKKMIRKCLLKQHVYTPDFMIIDDSRRLSDIFTYNYNIIWLDVKGSWASRGDGQEFSINQKWMMQVHGIYVNKIIPEKLFMATFVPDILRVSAVRRKPTKFYNCKSGQQWIESL